MFIYLFLATAIVTSPEPETINPELQEIIMLFTQDENTAENSAQNMTEKATDVAEVIVATPAPIIITNSIEPHMLEYKHWTGKYSPETFTIKVNGVEIAQGEKYELTTQDTPVEISYNYSFMKGMRSGTKKVTYKINANISHAQITFSWKDDWKVLVDNGTAIKEEVI